MEEECPWGPIEGERRICGALVRVEELPGGLCRYTRRGPRGGERVLLLGGCDLEASPSPPLLYPERVGYILVKLSPGVVLPPGGVAEVEASVELDAAVLLGGGLVDAFPTGRGKLGLYGPPSGGVLARLVEAQPPPRGGRCSGLLRIVLRSRVSVPVAVSRVLVPGLGLAVENRGCRPRLPWVEVEVVSPREARVTVAQHQQRRGGGLQGYVPLPFLQGSARTVAMRHGL